MIQPLIDLVDANIPDTTDVTFVLNIFLAGILLFFLVYYLFPLVFKKSYKDPAIFRLTKDIIFILGYLAVYYYILVGKGVGFGILDLKEVQYRLIIFMISFVLTFFFRKFTGSEIRGIIVSYLISFILLFILNYGLDFLIYFN